jgi:hypothetical protein
MVNYTHFSGTYASKESNLSTSPLWRPLFRIEGEKWEFEGGFAAHKLPAPHLSIKERRLGDNGTSLPR